MTLDLGAQGNVAPARCVPCLHVTADTLFVDDGHEVQTAMLRLDFAYGDRRVRSDAMIWAGRDRDAESQACRVLEGLGPEQYRGILSTAQKEAERRYALYQQLASIHGPAPAPPVESPAGGKA